MARVNNLTNFLTDVATAIKSKKGSEVDIPAVNFDTEIMNLPSQGVYQQKTVTIRANGTQTIIPDENYDAIDEIEIITLVPEKELQIKNYTFTNNATLELTPDDGYDGFSKVGLTINVSSGGEDLTNVLNAQDQKITALKEALQNKTANTNIDIYQSVDEMNEHTDAKVGRQAIILNNGVFKGMYEFNGTSWVAVEYDSSIVPDNGKTYYSEIMGSNSTSTNRTTTLDRNSNYIYYSRAIGNGNISDATSERVCTFITTGDSASKTSRYYILFGSTAHCRLSLSGLTWSVTNDLGYWTVHTLTKL